MPSTKQAAVKRRAGAGKRSRRQHLSSIRPSSSGYVAPVPVPPSRDDSSTYPSPCSSATTPTMTASASKLGKSQHDFATITSTLPTTIVDLNCLFPLLSGVRCSSCRDGRLELITKGEPQGLSICLTLKCSSCLFEKQSIFTSPRLDDRSFAVNRAAVSASLAGGFGYSGLKYFCEFMDMPLLTESTFQEHSGKIHEKAIHFKEDSLRRSAQAVREEYIKTDPSLKDKEFIDITVSYDGSWHKRGHTSNNGIGCVIDSKTGLVLDYHIMSKFCKVCVTEGEKIRKVSESENAEWMSKHEERCGRNFLLSSGAMEVEAALVCWQRSMERGLRYTNVISDGDCKTIKKLNEAQPYGPSVEVQKEECVNHVAKRLGKALRTLVDTKKKQGITLGGRGEGKLTLSKMDKLQKYYARAIRSNDTLEGMRESVMAIFLHCTSTDENPQHDSCPEGVDSWCFFQRATATGESPQSHRLKLGSFLSPDVAKHVKEVFERMSSNELLSRCLAGKTQNANESLHSVLWSKCPKNIFFHRNRLETSIAVAVGEFNEGSSASRRFMEMQGLTCGMLSVKHGLKRDRRRLYFSKYVEEEKNKDRKKKRDEARRKELSEVLDQEKSREGGLLYEAGGDD